VVASATASPQERREGLFLPDFCAPGAVLTVVLIAELVAILLTLAKAGHGLDVPVWMGLARNSLFMLWIGLSSAAALCYSRRWRARLSVAGGAGLSLALLLLVTAGVSEVAWWINHYSDALLLPPDRAANETSHLGFLLRNLMICLIVSGAALRYFYVSNQWRRNVESAATARVNALQARIRPHFLFNSMNTIAALTRTDPAAAEEAIEDLADLFRASLADAAEQVTIAEEIEIARVYERIEALRLGERLAVEWRVADLPPQAEMPSLSLQPLLENAIYHGIETLPGGGTVSIIGRRHGDDRLEIEIANPLPPTGTPARLAGNRMALVNIRERFRLLWGERAVVEHGPEGGEYRVRLRFPATDSRRPGSAGRAVEENGVAAS
jgi:two-component system sensor histidine kinase AlgZ